MRLPKLQRTQSYFRVQVHSTKRAAPRPSNKLSDVETTTEATSAVLTAEVVAAPPSVVPVAVADDPAPVVAEPPAVPPVLAPVVGATFAGAAAASFLNSSNERVALAAVLEMYVSLL